MALSVPKSGLGAMLKDGAKVHVHGFIASCMHVKIYIYFFIYQL